MNIVKVKINWREFRKISSDLSSTEQRLITELFNEYRKGFVGDLDDDDDGLSSCELENEYRIFEAGFLIASRMIPKRLR